MGHYWRLISDNLPLFAEGVARTVLVSTLASAIALLVAIFTAALLRTGPRALVWLIRAYIEVFRNTPVLLQIFIAYFALPSLGIPLSPFQAGVGALAANGVAYLTVIMHAGLSSIPKGQIESARVMGLPRRSSFARIVLPQATRNVYPAVINQFIIILQASALLSTISYTELTSVTLILNAQTFETLALFSFALLCYLLIASLVSLIAAQLERTLFKWPAPAGK